MKANRFVKVNNDLNRKSSFRPKADSFYRQTETALEIVIVENRNFRAYTVQRAEKGRFS